MEVTRSMWKNFKKALEDRYVNNAVYTRSQMIKRDLAVLWLLFAFGVSLCFIGYMIVFSPLARLVVTVIGGTLMTLWSLSTLIDYYD